MVPVPLPDAVLAFARRSPSWAAWVDRLPALLREVLTEWELAPDGALQHGHASVVVPVRSAGDPAMLKLAYPDDEGEHEALGLQHWGGRGAVRLLRADPRRRLLLLERLEPIDLTSVDPVSACQVVAALYRRLHVPAPPQLRRLTTYVDHWTARLAALARDAPVPHRLVEQAVSLGRDLATDPATDGVLVHGDLHGENVLAASREPWLAIDPKPVSGDPYYEPAPMLWNRWDEAARSGDVRLAVRRRFHTLVDDAGLDEHRARSWVVVRMLHNTLWEIEDADREHRIPDADWLTRCVTVAKAVQD